MQRVVGLKESKIDEKEHSKREDPSWRIYSFRNKDKLFFHRAPKSICLSFKIKHISVHRGDEQHSRRDCKEEKEATIPIRIHRRKNTASLQKEQEAAMPLRKRENTTSSLPKEQKAGRYVNAKTQHHCEASIIPRHDRHP